MNLAGTTNRFDVAIAREVALLSLSSWVTHTTVAGISTEVPRDASLDRAGGACYIVPHAGGSIAANINPYFHGG
jgi:hypothetical protein